MDFSAELDQLQRQIAGTQEAVTAATTESREQLRRRIDQAQRDAARADQDTRNASGRAGQSKWSKIRADASEKRTELKARMDKRNRAIDANLAADDAALAEADAVDALDSAARTLDTARVAILDAIDARTYANAQAGGER